MIDFRFLLLAIAFGLLPLWALGQGSQVAFGGLQIDPELPVEMSADQLTVDQNDGSAIFTGNVVVGQGEMRLSAAKVEVEYADDEATGSSRISKMTATGGVVLVNGPEVAEAQNAIYTIDDGRIVMTGNVLLTQGRNALSAERMVVNLNSGTAVMEGRVKSIIQTGNN